MKSLCKKIIRFFNSIHAFFWCLIHGVKYKKGLYIGRHVKKERYVKLVVGCFSRISHNCLLWGNGTIEIGDNSSIGSWSRIYSSKYGGVKIGSNTMSASHLYIIDSDHSTSKNDLIVNQKLISKKVTIGDDVWMGYNVTILRGVNLDNGVVCGACSLVTKSFSKNAIIGGVPAKIIKYRE